MWAESGDPFSPYLFLLCVEGLSRTLSLAADRGNITESQVCPDSPRVTHLLFADDSLIFFRADNQEAIIVKSLLQRYDSMSGQAINLQKSGVMFSTNVGDDQKLRISEILGVINTLHDRNYLGLPSLIGKSKKTVFNFIKDRVWKQLEGWNTKLLSKAGKVVMIKSVAQAIPSYCMSCFQLPKTLCDQIWRMLIGFGGNQTLRRIDVFDGTGGKLCVCLKAMGVWVLRIFMALTWHCWVNIVGTSSRIQIHWMLVFIKPNISLIAICLMLIKGWVLAISGQSFGRRRKL